MGETLFTNYDEFAEEIRKELSERTGQDVIVSSIMKNNDVVLKGLTIRGDSNISPTIYLEKYYERYSDETMTFEEICDDIMDVNEEHKCPNFDFDIEDYTSWDKIKDRIKMRLVNRDRNAEYLKQLVHMIYGDLAIIFAVELEANPFGVCGSIKIRNEHAEMWDKTVGDLYEVAKNNMDEIVVTSIFDVISEMQALSGDEFADITPPEGAPIMYIATNPDKNCGAAAMLNEEVLKNFASDHGSFYIIPSSIHEVIFLALNGCNQDSDEISAMIQGINCEIVNPDEVLGDHAYYYDADTDTLYSEYGGDEMLIEAVAPAA